MTERLIVAMEHLTFFKESCKRNKIPFELTSEGIDGDTYTVTFDFPGELYFLGRDIQLSIDGNAIKKLT